ncbi:MAG: argininosuccinate lyase [Gemmatimonadota bacterium]|nr:argininosuccinate lyase [Gemmatimonadota bacterium]
MTPRRPDTLWSPSAKVDEAMLRYTVGNDREVDRELLPWDVLGSLGHIDGLQRSRLLSDGEHRRLRSGLRAAWKAVHDGSLVIGQEHEDAHSAVEVWLTNRVGTVGQKLHTGRSRNDQVTVDLRLWLKERVLALHGAAAECAEALVALASAHQRTLMPGYTHTRRAMPSSIGLWAAAYAEGLLDSLESLPGLWARIDRSPLGSAAGYGVPLPLNREATAKALGFAGLDHNVGTVQNGRGKLEAATLFWCTELAHELSRLSADVILFSAAEYGYLILPPELATGSSIMPQKRNPDLFELTRARAAGVEGDLATVMALKAKLSGGYHRDFQLLKEPLFRGVASTRAMLGMVALAVPRLGVDAERCRAALSGDALVTDEALRRTEMGQPFRAAYRDVAAEFKSGATFPEPSVAALLARRRSTGGVGNLELPVVRGRLRTARAWQRREATRFTRAMARLAGRSPA